jgi:hypothetical protein
METDPRLTVKDSCGCVFCDLDLEAKQAGLGGGFYHEIKANGSNGLPTNRFIRCPIKSSKTATL